MRDPLEPETDRRWDPARLVAFVALHVVLVTAYLDWLVHVLPPLAEEGGELVVTPVSAIAAVAFAAMHPLLGRARTHLGRLAILTSAIALGVVAFTGVVLARLGAPEPTLLSAALFGTLVVSVQLLHGAPLFLGLAVSMKLTSPVLLARPARGRV